jgi:hypothetical protein
MAVEGNREPDQVPVSKFSVSITQTATPPISPAIPPVTNPTSSYLDVPFADFVGRCFLRGCLCADLVESWIRKKQAQADAKIESAASWRYHLRVMGWVRSSLGAASCTALAGCLIPVFGGNAYRAIIPFFFLVVILYVALRFGHIAGIIGTVCAALVFELFLFEPTLSLAIENPSARNHLISMVILGICASEILGRRKVPVAYKPW